MDKRFRKAKTYHNWCEQDGLDFGGEWYFFKDGDIVEFKVDGELIQRKVQVKNSGTTMPGMGYTEHLNVSRVFVKAPRKLMRIVDVPPVRIIK